MKVLFQLNDQLLWVRDFLPHNFYKKLHLFVFKNNKKVSVDVSKTWSPSLLNYLKPPKILHLNNSLQEEYINFLKKQPFVNFSDKKITFAFYKMDNKSGINWHDDHGHEYAATFYLNNRWSHSWGGEFMFKTKDQAGFLPIIGNSLILVKSSLWHKVNPVLSPIIPRFSIQSFINEKACS